MAEKLEKSVRKIFDNYSRMMFEFISTNTKKEKKKKKKNLANRTNWLRVKRSVESSDYSHIIRMTCGRRKKNHQRIEIFSYTSGCRRNLRILSACKESRNKRKQEDLDTK